jgi:exportin-2 (importin alpha re-exporter)
MSDVPSLLKASLSPATRKDAETRLEQLTTQPGFLPHLLGLCVDPNQDRSVRLAASVYLKNVAKLKWMEARRPLDHPLLS